MENHYQILNVDVAASEAEVHSAYRESVRRCHPDLYPDDREALERFHRVQAAFEVLADPRRRASYDPNEAPVVKRASPKPHRVRPGRRAHLEGVIFQRGIWFGHARRCCSSAVDEDAELLRVKIGSAASMILGYAGMALYLWYATGFVLPGD